jgi:hypothetical protein
MSFDKEYPNRKDKRKPFKGAKAIDYSCRNNRGCKACLSNRQHKNIKRAMKAEEEMNEYE